MTISDDSLSSSDDDTEDSVQTEKRRYKHAKIEEIEEDKEKESTKND